MAATPLPPPPLNASFSPFDIFNDGGAARNTPPPPSPGLPGGPCNFVDLTHGPNGPKCGCRRFWGRQVAGAGTYTTDQMGWCMCSHHACFHDDVQSTQGQPAPAAPAPVLDNMPGQENEKPRSNRTPLSPVQDFVSFHMPNSLGAAAVDFATLNFDHFAPPEAGLGAGLLQSNHPGPPPEGDSMPDTLSWKNVVSTQGGHATLPPFPSQCLLPESQSASTTVSSQMRYLQPFGGKGLNTLSSVPQKDRDSARVTPRTGAGADPITTKGGQISDDAIAVGSGEQTPAPGPSRAMGPPPPASVLSVGHGIDDTLENLTGTVNSHERRLERIETGSIYETAHEDCSEKHDMADLRVTELEGRMDEVEKRLNDDGASVASSRHTTQRDDDATISVVSGTFHAPALAADRAALHSQLEALQARVNQLEASSLPSCSSPWELEVVFLPFPLKGIWQEAQDFKTPRLSGGRDEWTQLPNTNSRATPDPQTLAACDEWVGQDSGWLLPRACVPGRMIDQRLRSRGLVKTVSVRGGDARSVQVAVGNAFESILRLIPSPASPRSPYVSDGRVDRFLGLQQSWVPLRKVHKDSRLRFLSPAELLTPVIWNSTFLMDSVIMKATGIHRLYITQPDAYLQDSHLLSQHGAEPGWTWQRLRELPRVYPESQGSSPGSEVPEADALEEHWSYNGRLDEPSAPRQPSVSPYQSHEKAVAISRTSDGSTQRFYTGPSNPMSSMLSPVHARGQSPLFQRERKGSHPLSIRAGSVPPINSPVMPSPRSSSRRISSYALLPSLAGPSYQRHSSPITTGRPSPRLSMINPTPVSIITKHRRRTTRSPSLRLHNTPRYSHRSFSRSPSVTPFFQHIIPEEPIRGDRRVTPFAYATPHSNVPPDYPPPRIHSRSHSRSIQQVFVDEEDEEMHFDEDHGSSTDDDDEDDPDIDVYEDERDMLDDLESDSDHHPSGQARPLQDQQQQQPLSRQQQQQQPPPQPPPPQQPQGPEDEVWPGIEDNDMSDGENVDPRDDADNRSDVSSVPSVYPSTQRAWRLHTGVEGREMTHGLDGDEAGGVGFRIHVDDGDGNDDGDSERPEAQGQW